MDNYMQLNQEQRYQISGLLKAGLKQTKIAAELGVNKGTISRERRQSCINGKRFSFDEWQKVERLTWLWNIGAACILLGGYTPHQASPSCCTLKLNPRYQYDEK